MISLCGDTESNVCMWREGIFQGNVTSASHFMRQVVPVFLVFCISINWKMVKQKVSSFGNRHYYFDFLVYFLALKWQWLKSNVEMVFLSWAWGFFLLASWNWRTAPGNEHISGLYKQILLFLFFLLFILSLVFFPLACLEILDCWFRW